MRWYKEGLFIPKGTPAEKRMAAFDLIRRIVAEDPVVAEWLPDSGDWTDPAELEILVLVADHEILAVAWSEVRIVIVVADPNGGFAHHVPRPTWRPWRETVDPTTYVAELARQKAGPVDRQRATPRRDRSRARSGRPRGARPAPGDGLGLVDFARLRCRPQVVCKLRELFGAHHAGQAAQTIAQDFHWTYQAPLEHPLRGVRKTKRRKVSWVSPDSAVVVTVARRGKADYSVEWRAPRSSAADRRPYVHAIWRGGADRRPGSGSPGSPRGRQCR